MESSRMHSPARPRVTTSAGFTLIEVLVVVAIIALLAAILIPSLQRAREQSKLLSCQVNAKQIATAMSTYQTEAQGFVPIVTNWHAGPVYGAPARAVFLSVALRNQDRSLTNLGSRQSSTGAYFDPNQTWTQQMRDDYEARFLPPHYVCPFERGREPWDLRQVGQLAPHTLWEWSGIMESYQTWLWEDINRGEKVHSEPFGWRLATNGLPKYSVLTWNNANRTIPKLPPSHPDVLHRLHRRWNASEARQRPGGTLSTMTVMYCAIGEHMEMGSRRIDVGSHRTGRGGGTNVVFADTHVEWVEGARVGWP